MKYLIDSLGYVGRSRAVAADKGWEVEAKVLENVPLMQLGKRVANNVIAGEGKKSVSALF